jgi:DNA processing protein
MLGVMPDIHRILRLERDFPDKLLDMPRWPAELQVQGTLKDSGLGVAIVGARAATAAGMHAAHELAADLVRAGHRIISGGALGIDAAAHRGALAQGGYTLAVMACGLDQCYPRRNQRLFDAIVEGGGAMVSPFALGQPPLRRHFVQRNAIIAALADVVVVVEASLGSGSLHTARFALQQGRPLAAYGKSPGCESLLARGVPLVCSGAEVLELVAGNPRYKRADFSPEPSSSEATILASLSESQAQSASALAQVVELPLRQTQRILHRLELACLVVVEPGQRYLRSPLASRDDFR